jgi:hypothetical protein
MKALEEEFLKDGTAVYPYCEEKDGLFILGKQYFCYHHDNRDLENHSICPALDAPGIG